MITPQTEQPEVPGTISPSTSGLSEEEIQAILQNPELLNDL
jgi:hypothetical protein